MMKRRSTWFGIVVVAVVVAISLCGEAWARTQVCATDIDNYLRDNGSPMEGTGVAYVKWGKYFNVDPRLMIGISNAESTLGKSPCGTNDTGTWNAWGWFGGLGHCWPYLAPGWDSDTDRAEFADAPGYVAGQGINMASGWEDGIFWVTRTIRKEYPDQGYDTVDKIKPKWCTSGCTNWAANTKVPINGLGGDPNSLDFPGDSCSGGGCTAAPSANFDETNKGKWFNNADFAVASWTIQDRGGGSGGWRQNWDGDPGDGSRFTSTSGYLRFADAGRQEGNHTVHIRTWCGDGSKSEEFTSGSYGYDATPPTVTITSGHINGSTYNTPQRITWQLGGEDGRSGLKNWTQAWDNSTPGGPFTSTTGWLDLPEGTHTLHVHAWDNARNDKDWTWTFTYQKVGTLSISTTSNAGCPVGGAVSVNGQSYSQSWGNAPQSRTVNVGTYTVSFGAVTGWTTPGNQQAVVNDGQTTSKTGTYKDETPPTLTVTQAPAADTCLPAPQNICWTVSDICGTPTVEYSWDGAAYAAPNGNCVTTPEGTHTLRLKATDSANPANVREITVGTFIVDATVLAAPTNLTVTTNHYSASLTWTAPNETGCAGIAGYNVYRKRSDGGSYAKVNTDLVTPTTFTDSVANGVSYDYGVAAVDTFNREGPKVEITNKVIGAPGDLNGDGDIDISDVIIAINVIANPNATAVQKALADYDRSGVADAADVEAMKKTILGK